MNPVSFFRFLFLYSWVSFLFLRVSVSGSAATIFPSAQKAARTRLQNTCNPRHEKFRPDRLRGWRAVWQRMRPMQRQATGPLRLPLLVVARASLSKFPFFPMFPSFSRVNLLSLFRLSFGVILLLVVFFLGKVGDFVESVAKDKSLLWTSFIVA